MAKKVTGYIKLQIPAAKAGSTGWTCSWTEGCQHCTVYKGV